MPYKAVDDTQAGQKGYAKDAKQSDRTGVRKLRDTRLHHKFDAEEGS